MRLERTCVGLALLASGQKSNAARYCDPVTSFCFSGWTGGDGITIGVAMPNASVAPFDTVLQIVSPFANGWVGFSWGGTMPYVPLTVGWANNASNTAIYSSRMAYGLSLPQAYTGAEYSYLKGTGQNKTHYTINVRCRGCSQWNNVDGNLVSLDPKNTTLPFAHAYSKTAPVDPTSNSSRFNVHTSFGHWTLDLTQGVNADFNKLVAANLASSSSTPSSTPPASSTPTSSIVSTISSVTTAPIPTQSGMPSTCSGVPVPAFSGVTTAGWRAVKVVGGLTQPRGIVLDTSGNLLAVQNSVGISGHVIGPDGCITSTKTIISQRNLNHGIALSPDGKTLYASSATSVWAWSYNAANMTISGDRQTVITGMSSNGHVTRTLAIPPKHPNLLLLSHGSSDNFDMDAGNIKTERSVIKGFNLTSIPSAGYNFVTDGYQMGYGLRNHVGLAFDANGMLWGVENGSDEVHRTINSKVMDIHLDNPADELNYLGDPSKENLQWYGYPTCNTVWSPHAINDTTLSVGDQFVMEPNSTFNDATCKEKSVPARLVFQAHSAPLDMAFSKDYSNLFVTFHGSSDRDKPTGYKFVQVPFATKNGSSGPVASANSTQGYSDVWWNADDGLCSATHCFRPVGIAKDRFERMYVSSDGSAEGEIFLLGRV